jgi:hypothetical protein
MKEATEQIEAGEEVTLGFCVACFGLMPEGWAKIPCPNCEHPQFTVTVKRLEAPP